MDAASWQDPQTSATQAAGAAAITTSRQHCTTSVSSTSRLRTRTFGCFGSVRSGAGQLQPLDLAGGHGRRQDHIERERRCVRFHRDGGGAGSRRQAGQGQGHVARQAPRGVRSCPVDLDGRARLRDRASPRCGPVRPGWTTQRHAHRHAPHRGDRRSARTVFLSGGEQFGLDRHVVNRARPAAPARAASVRPRSPSPAVRPASPAAGLASDRAGC